MSNTVRMPMSEPARRIEVFTGAGRRRRWSDDEKAAIVAESLGESESVSSVARRHGLTPSQLFAWRREARQPVNAEQPEPMFVPAVMEPAPSPAVKQRRRRRSGNAAIELKIDGVVVRVGQGARAATVAAVIRALKAGS